MKLNPNFVLRQIAGEQMLVPVGAQTNVTNGLVTLSPVAAVIWEALHDGKDRQGALEAVLDAFEVDPAVAEADLDEFLGQMKAAGLLEA